MYDISVPLFATSPTLNKERALKDIKLLGAKRVFLAIPDSSHEKDIMESYYAALEKLIPFFQNNGLEVGVWFWTFRVATSDAKFTVMVNALGDKCHTSTAKYCPLDEDFLDFTANHVKRIAELSPDLIMFDDDLAFGFTSMLAPACFCELHRGKMAEILGEDVPLEGLYEKMFSGKKNRYRSAFLQVCGDSLRQFAKRMREAVDSVNPSIRMGQCGCITTFDYDGVDSFTLSKILAGDTKPFLRLIGAPYWDSVRLHGNRLVDVIELERMERSWYEHDDIEIFSEGDTYPRPRHAVPASHLEIFDAALRADGGMDGILKYTMDYTASADYERGYLNAHIKDEEDLLRIGELFGNLSHAGVRIYESMKKIEDADYSKDVLTVDFIRYQFFSRAVRFLAHNSIPAAHKGPGCAGICFGENARALDVSSLDKPLILDATAAAILEARGIDVGLIEVGERFMPGREHFLRFEEHIPLVYGSTKIPFASKVSLKEGVCLESEWIADQIYPGSYTYTNRNGQSFLVLCMDAFTCADEMYKNYARQKQIFDFLDGNNASVPARCDKHPDLYILCKENENTLAVALFNCFADEIENLEVKLSSEYLKLELFRAEGALNDAGNILHISNMPAYSWCYAVLRK